MGARGTQSGSRYRGASTTPAGYQGSSGSGLHFRDLRDLRYAENIVTAQGSSLPQITVPRAAEKQAGDEDDPSPQF